MRTAQQLLASALGLPGYTQASSVAVQVVMTGEQSSKSCSSYYRVAGERAAAGFDQVIVNGGSGACARRGGVYHERTSIDHVTRGPDAGHARVAQRIAGALGPEQIEERVVRHEFRRDEQGRACNGRAVCKL